MRNLLAGLFGSIVGTLLIVVLLGMAQPGYPQPYDAVWFIFTGADALQSTFGGFLNLNTIGIYLITWIIVGFIIAPFSRHGWNLVRSALWVGVFVGIFSIFSLLLINPGFWNDPERNVVLVYQFAISIGVSMFSISSAYPISILIERAKKEQETPIPEKIETRCQCGAVFKSNPIMCSECGAILREMED